MSIRPFRLKGRRLSPASQSSEESSSNCHIDRYDSDGESISDTDSVSSGFRNCPGDSDLLSPRSISPASTSSMGTNWQNPSLSPLAFGFNPESFQFYQTVKPSAVLLEKSIASLPAGSDMKNTLIHIRHQMKQSLLRLKELEDQVKNIPTLQVRISVLQEEKRQLLWQLQSKSTTKKNRYGHSVLYYNSLRQRGCKSDTEEDEDEFSSTRRKLRLRLNSTGDQPEESSCERCKNGELFPSGGIKTPRTRGTQTNIKGVDAATWKTKDGEYGVWSKEGHLGKCGDINSNFQASREVATRSIGVGVMRSFTKECGVGCGVAVLDVKDEGVQRFIEKSDAACDAMEIEQHDEGITAKPSVISIGTLTEQTALKHMPIKMDSNSTGTQTTILEPLVTVGVGICTIDDEFCVRCATTETCITTKSIDEIMASQIDLPVYRSIGVGDAYLQDNYLCYRCSNLKTTDTGSGELSLEDSYFCHRCCNIRTKDTATGDVSVEDEYFCDRCFNVSTRAVGSGDGSISDITCEKCRNASKESTSVRTSNCNNLKSVIRKTHSTGVGNCRVTDSFCNNCNNKKSRSLGIGNHSISEMLCDKCVNIKTKSVGSNTLMDTRTIGVSNSCITDSYCDRCMSIRMKSVGVGECCLSDSFCDRCFHVQTKSVGIGDIDVNEIQCEHKGLTSDDRDSYIRHPKVLHLNGDANKADISSFVTTRYSWNNDAMDSSELSETAESTLTAVSDAVESDEDSIDHDNPSSDSTGRMSEPIDSFQHSRIRMCEDVILACKMLNGHLYRGKEIGREQMVSCMSTVENKWFECVTSPKCRADVMRGYVKTFRLHIPVLLETIINMSDADGNNALHYTVTYRNWKATSELLKTGCVNVDLPNRAGYSAVMLAALTGLQREEFKHVARRLLEIGDVNKRMDETGQTPLMLAVSRGRLDMVELLIETDVNINDQDYDGSTATMCACEHGYTNIARRLLAQPGCDSSLEDNEGSTALSIAMERNFKDIAVLIYAHSNFASSEQGKKRTSVV